MKNSLKSIDSFNRKIKALLLSANATQPSLKYPHEWMLYTKGGKLNISLREGEASHVFCVFCRFDDPHKADIALGGTLSNKYSGKHNFIEYDADDLVRQFNSFLSKIVLSDLVI